MKPSTKTVTIEIEDALAKLQAQIEHSASIIDRTADDLAPTRPAIAGQLRREAAAMRNSARSH